VVLDAGTGFGIMTLEIAKRLSTQKQKGRIISVDIDPKCFELAKRLLEENKLTDLVTFVEADLSNMPQIESESIDVVISTRTISDINRFPCRLLKAISEFYRVLKEGGQIVLSDECPRYKPLSEEEEVAVLRWQLAKAISHLVGRPHGNEVEPDDLEFMMRLVGFRRCEWAIFEGDRVSERRIEHFVEKSSEMASKLSHIGLRKAFLEAIKDVRRRFHEKGGVFPPKYVIHALK